MPFSRIWHVCFSSWHLPRSYKHIDHDDVASILSCLSFSIRGRLQCCCCLPCGTRHEDMATIVEDNCCRCNYAALSRMLVLGEIEVIYATFHVDVGETPFFVALDYTKRKVCRCRRGLSRISFVNRCEVTLSSLNKEARFTLYRYPD